LLPAVDIVILTRSGIGTLSSEDLRKKIDKLWRDLIQKSGRPTPCEAR
jgi:RNase P protein component